MTATQIDDTYNELVSSIDRQFRRLRQALAEQEMKDEEERLKAIQVRIRLIFRFFLINKNIKYLEWI
jgi:CHASE3 domain sensor protein